MSRAEISRCTVTNARETQLTVEPAESLEYIDAKSGKTRVLHKNAFSGQWMHPDRGYDVCGYPSRTYESQDGQDPARSPVCLIVAGRGTDHLGAGFCKLHSGSGGIMADNGRALLRNIKARQALQTLGIPYEIDPEDALLALVHEAAGNVAFLGGRVSELGFQLVGDVMSLTRNGDAVPTTEDVRSIVKLYNEERDRLAKYSKIALEAGIAARKVKLMEDQAAVVVAVLRAVVGRMDLTDGQRTEALTMIADELRSMSTNGTKTINGSAVIVR